MCGKYRPAIYAYDDEQCKQTADIVDALRADFDEAVITQVYPFRSFRRNKIELTDYFYSAPNRPFCQSYIQPKLNLLLACFNSPVDQAKLAEAGLQ